MLKKVISIFFIVFILSCILCPVAFADGMKDAVEKDINSKYDGFNTSVQDAIAKLSKDPKAFSPQMGAIMETIQGSLKATAYVLCAFFFIIDLCNKTLMLETSNYEVVAKLLIRFIFAKVMVDNCSGVMGLIFAAFGGVMTKLGAAGSIALGTSAKQSVLDTLNNIDGGILGINYFIYWMGLQPSLLVIWAVSLLTGVIVLGRMFEILIYTAVAPLPISTLAGETTNDTAKKFFQNYISVCLQGVIIIIAFQLFGGMMTDAFTGNIDPIAYLMLIVVFALTLFKSGTWAKSIVGVA